MSRNGPPDDDAPAAHGRLTVTIVEFTPSGGLYHFALQLGEAIAALGHDVELLTGHHPELMPRHPGLRVVPSLPTWRPGASGSESSIVRKVRRAWRALRYIAAWRRVVSHVRKRRPDVVQLGDLRFAIDGHYVARLAKLRRRPVLVDLAHTPRPHRRGRGDETLHKQGPVVERGLGRAYATFDAVLVLGERSAGELREAWPQVGRVEIVPHGLDGIFSTTTVAPPDRTEPVALFFGNFDRYKGLDLLLDAFAIVHARMPEARLVAAGSVSPDLDFSDLRERAAAIDGVDLRPGYVANEDVPALFEQSRVVVLPYRAANQSGVVHVAQGFGRPVVVTDVGDLAEVVGDGVSGLVVGPDDHEALAAAIERLLRDPAEAARLGENGRQRAASDASWSEVATRIGDLYTELVASRTSRAPSR
jgi:glycosyltransferase involved in cell wall biosynthesis